MKNTTGVTTELLYIQGHKCRLSLSNPREEYNRSHNWVTLYSWFTTVIFLRPIHVNNATGVTNEFLYIPGLQFSSFFLSIPCEEYNRGDYWVKSIFQVHKCHLPMSNPCEEYNRGDYWVKSIFQVHKCHLPLSNPCEEYNRGDYCVKSIFQIHKCHLPMSNLCEEYNRGDYCVNLYSRFTNVIFLCSIHVKNTTGVTTVLNLYSGSQMSSFFVQSPWRLQQEWQMSYSLSQVHIYRLSLSVSCEEYNRSDYWVTLYPRFLNIIFVCPFPVKNTTGVTTELLYIPGSQISSFFVRFLWRIQQEWLLSYSISQVLKCHLSLSVPCEEYNRSDYWVTLYPRFTNIVFLCPFPVKNTTGVTTELLYIPGSQISSFSVRSLWRIQQEWLLSYSISQVHKYRLSLSVPCEEYNRSDYWLTL